MQPPKKIASARKKLASWQTFIPDFGARRVQEFMPLHQVFEDSQAAFACHLESFTPRKSFTRAQREKLEHLILETCRSTILRTVLIKQKR